MKKLYFILLLLTWGSLAVLNAQMGNTINYQDDFGSATLEFTGEVNGRNAYTAPNTGLGDVNVNWTGERWEIFTTVPNMDVLFASDLDVGPNPPNLTTGQWQTTSSEQLITFEGSGTQEVLTGDECAIAIQIDSLFGGEVDEVRVTRSYNVVDYSIMDLLDPNVTCGGLQIAGYKTIWFSFIGDGLDYEIILDTVGLENPNLSPLVILLNGVCGETTEQYCTEITDDFYRIPSFSTVTGTEYKLLVADSGNFVTNSNARIQITRQETVGTNEIDQVSINVYPNPTNDLLYFQGETPVRVELMDLTGRRVLVSETAGNSVDLSGLPTGMYTLVAQMRDGKTGVSRVVKQ